MSDEVAEVWKQLDVPVWLVTAAAGGERGGLIATFVNQASIVPNMPRVVVGLARQHHTWKLVDVSRCFVLHLFEESRLDWVWHFGLSGGRDRDKLAAFETVTGPTGTPRLAGALAWLDCQVEAELDSGDRSVYLARVVDGRVERAGRALTTQRLIQLAPPERLCAMREQLAVDAAIDAAAIEAWGRRDEQG